MKDEVVATEVDRIKGGKKGKYDVKGKGKDARGKDGTRKGFGSYQNFQNYKGKGKSHGDFKGKGRDGKGKHEGKFGKGKFEKGKEKGKSKDSGEDGKGKGQGWNSGTWNQYGNSNWNWNYNRVRQVDETHADSSQVSTTSPSASVSQVAGSETNKTVRLITEPNASSPVVFDFTGGSSSYGDGYVRTISEVVDVQSDEDEENHGRHARVIGIWVLIPLLCVVILFCGHCLCFTTSVDWNSTMFCYVSRLSASVTYILCLFSFVSFPFAFVHLLLVLSFLSKRISLSNWTLSITFVSFTLSFVSSVAPSLTFTFSFVLALSFVSFSFSFVC